MLNQFNKPYVKSTAESQKVIKTNSKNKETYETPCYSKHVSISILKVNTINRFYDQLTRQLNQIDIKKLLNERLKKGYNYNKNMGIQEKQEEQQVRMKFSEQTPFYDKYHNSQLEQ
ncbi:unnamed protein product [Paramecium sonneborni]|uniref:Uncharacterized protein n=1 Tax=Paramecium sonneborni TaxID=65129 RepID=A0A8S1RLY8_9CILI|nr:unnamed protein product [Paramecium sonneborni]